MKEFIEILKKKNVDYKIEGNKIFITGDLSLRYSQIEELPENITLGGSLNLNNSRVKKLPKNLTVGGDIYLERSLIKAPLPETLNVKGCILS